MREYLEALKLVPSKTDFALSVPGHCDLCGYPIVGIYIDGKTTSGPWAIMCSMCFRDKGVGLGTGKGQRYEKQGAEGKWAKMVPASEAKPRKKMPSMR